MKKIFFLFLIIFAYNNVITAQKTTKAVDVALASNGKIFSDALSFYQIHHLGKKAKFGVGYGVRLTNYFGNDKNQYITAPAKVSEGNFFKKQNEAKLDTLTLGKGQINSINTAIYLSYDFSEKLGLGFNIDAFGLSWGAKQSGQVPTNGKNTAVPEAKVTAGNLLLTGDYDLGSLNSEIYVRYAINQHLQFRGGLSFLFSEYTTQKIASNFDNDRFRNKTLSPLVALSYKF